MAKSNLELITDRKRLMGSRISTFYDEPIHLVKGDGIWVWDSGGRRYLDCYNNVPHVGHCHPKVTEAIYKQSCQLNTHTRYLHEGIVRYLDKLTSTFLESISSAILTCTGSEANDLALRMGAVMSGKTGLIATDHTYHGNTAVVSQLSLTNSPRIGNKDNIRYVPAPDSYRPLGGKAGMDHGHAFAAEVKKMIEELESSGHGFSAIIVCPFFANEGFPNLCSGFLDPTVELVHDAGGILIADEVQPGFGRLGSHMWGHQKIGLKPDIVTLGKPMGNGYPIAGVITSPEILSAFQDAFRYFNTFGGNPVACAAGEAVLDILGEEKLVERALDVGSYSFERLKDLSEKYSFIGDVRGSGLFFGAELVIDSSTREPDPNLAQKVVNEMRSEGILINRTGINYNTLKIRPNMQFSRENADLLVDTLEKVLNRIRKP